MRRAERAPGGRGWLVVLLAAACGPSDEALAASVVAASPMFYVLAWLALRSIWQARGDVALHDRVHAVVIAGLAVLTLLAAGDADGRWFHFTLWLLGSTVLGLWAIVWRIGHAFAPGSAAAWSGPLTTAVWLVPALAVWGGWFGEPRDIGDVVVGLWVLPGGFGLTPLIMLVALAVEARRVEPPETPL